MEGPLVLPIVIEELLALPVVAEELFCTFGSRQRPIGSFLQTKRSSEDLGAIF